MKALFFSPQLNTLIHSKPFPLGLLSICSYIQKNSSHEVKIIDRTLSHINLEEEIKKFSPDIVGISVLSPAVLDDAEIISRKCHEMGIYVVWGGHFATSCKDILIKEDFINAISIGRGEVTWLNLLNSIENKLDFSNIPGLLYKTSDGVITNAENLDFSCDEFPRSNFDLVDVKAYFAKYYDNIAEKMIWVFAKKGCHCQCTFCCNKSFNHQKVLTRPYEIVCDEIRELVEDYGADAIYFGDELWCSNREQMKMQCDMLAELNLDFVWGCTVRTDILNAEDYKYMYDHGCRWIFFGIESGDPERIKTIKKGIKLENAVENIKACYSAGILPTASFILGFPDETVSELTKTAALLKQLSYFATLDVYFFTPYPGSELYEQLISDGRLPKSELLSEIKNFGWNNLNEQRYASYSDIPYKDLKVIYACSIIWNTFNRKSVPINGEQEHKEHGTIYKLFSKVLDVFSSAFKNLNLRNTKLLITFLKSMFKKFGFAFFYALCYPNIRRKYSMTLFK